MAGSINGIQTAIRDRGPTLLLAAGLGLGAALVAAGTVDAASPPAPGQAASAAATDPAVAFMQRHQGIWRGVFRRYDADGKLVAELPSLIVSRVVVRDGRAQFHQTNRLRRPEAPEEAIDSFGDIRDGRVWFSNPRAEGWAMPVPGDATGRMGVLTLTYKDGSGLYMHEIVSLSDDGRSRSRVAQYLQDGRLVRRTQIDESKVTEDWAAYDPKKDKP